MEVNKSISPVEALIFNPAVELNVPPAVAGLVVGVGLVPDLQNSIGVPVNVILSAARNSAELSLFISILIWIVSPLRPET